MKRNLSWKETAVPDPVAITSRLDHRRPAGRSAAPAVLHELDQHEQTMEVEVIPEPGHEPARQRELVRSQQRRGWLAFARRG